MSHPHNESPVNPLPPAVVVIFLILAGVEVALLLGSRGLIGGDNAIGWRIGLIEDMAFVPKIMAWMLETSQYPLTHVKRFVIYPFVHGSFTHGIFAMVILLAMGKIVAEAMGQFAFVTLFFAASIVGAVAYGYTGAKPVLIGAYPGAYGLIGGFTYLMWLKLGEVGEPQYRAFQLIGFLLGIQLLFGMLFGSDPTWIAELVGFATGFLSSVALVPGGFAHLVSRLRRG
ncbi:MAG: rhomboid family intramembrane serine protease [Pelagimonas sp.]|jgi:membrane associated rhomboid family serine protease|nr:rhomboid family intramembrane serine protease [Pelagimonas sp.]